MNRIELSRRSFLQGTAAAAGVLALGARPAFAADDPYGGFRMGSQSYSFRKFDYKGAIERLKQLGLTNMEFCAAHFPPAPEHADLPAILAYIKESGITPISYGVENFAGDADANRLKFDFAKKMGLEVLTANPMHNAFDSLDKLTVEYGISIAIHNHGPGADYDGVKDTLKVVKDRNPRIGACVDTGHVIRSGEKPHEVLEALGDRVISMHLKDWVHKGEEQILGEGDMDLVAVAKVLRKIKFTGPIMLEFELFEDDPVPGMIKGLENWKKAVAAA
jgi:inosose dehydratase